MLRVLKNKKGSEMIEAAIVIPLLLLAAISLIYLGLYFHEGFREQLAVQEILISETMDKKDVFNILWEEASISGESRGLFGGGFHREYKQRLYVINEELVVRAGEVIGNIGDD